VMVSLPAVRLVPGAASDAVAFAPKAASVADPSDTFPAVKITVPVGAVVPLAALTVTLSVVEAFALMPAGLATSDTVLAISGAATVTTIPVDAEAVKFPLAA